MTGINLSYQSPQLVQQYECEETARDRFVEIPVSDIAEIGYIADGDAEGGKLRWLLIARSVIVRVFNPVHPDPTTEKIGLKCLAQNRCFTPTHILQFLSTYISGLAI